MVSDIDWAAYNRMAHAIERSYECSPPSRAIEPVRRKHFVTEEDAEDFIDEVNEALWDQRGEQGTAQHAQWLRECDAMYRSRIQSRSLGLGCNDVIDTVWGVRTDREELGAHSVLSTGYAVDNQHLPSVAI
jgi:hypothetical protein